MRNGVGEIAPRVTKKSSLAVILLAVSFTVLLVVKGVVRQRVEAVL